MSTFPNEDSLVLNFLEHLSERSGFSGERLRFVREFDYRRGRTDVVGLSRRGEVFAFEAKLAKWGDALHQAYRNTCFAHRSYVVVPRQAAEKARTRIADFRRRRVGLCYVDSDGLHVLEEAPRQEPLQRWLTARAISQIESSANEL